MSSADKTTNDVHDEQGEGTGLGYRPEEPAMTDRPEVGGARVAQVSLWQLNLLRVGYLVMGVGRLGAKPQCPLDDPNCTSASATVV